MTTEGARIHLEDPEGNFLYINLLLPLTEAEGIAEILNQRGDCQATVERALDGDELAELRDLVTIGSV